MWDWSGVEVATASYFAATVVPLLKMTISGNVERYFVFAGLNATCLDELKLVLITNIRGVTIVGNGNVVNTSFTGLARILAEMEQAVQTEPKLDEGEKLNIISDIDSLQSQLQRPEPQKSVIQSLWSGIEKAAAVGGLVEFLHRVTELIRPLLS